MALKLHPDQHGGCVDKQAEFQQLNEAYEEVLKDVQLRKHKEYKTAYNVNYRKVYAPRPPPEWEFVWDHKKHQSMHYGNGFQRQALKQAVRENKNHVYKSPLGRGFSFSVVEDDTPNADQANVNPYAKRTPQGPPKIVVEYEEADNMKNGKVEVKRQARIVEDLYDRRTKRKSKEREPEREYPQYERFKTNPTFVGRAPPQAPAQQNGECIIL